MKKLLFFSVNFAVIKLRKSHAIKVITVKMLEACAIIYKQTQAIFVTHKKYPKKFF